MSPIEEDELMEAVVMRLVLDEYPETITLDEAILELTRGRETPRPQAENAIRRAVAQLVGLGCLRPDSALLVPTRAISYFHRLPMDET